MFALEPGPFPPHDPASIPPYPTRPSFTGIVADALGELPALDARLAAAGLWAADNPPDELDAVFNATVGAANNEIDYQGGLFDQSPFADLVDQGDSEDLLRQSVLRYLPGADAPIETNFDEPQALT